MRRRGQAGRGHERVVVGDKGSGFGDNRGLGGGLVGGKVLGGGLEGEGGSHLPPWQWEGWVAVAPLLFRWRRVLMSRKR